MSLADDPIDDQIATEAAGHEHFAVRKVDQLQDAVHQGVAERDEGVHRALFQSDDDVLGQLLQPVFGLAHA